MYLDYIRLIISDIKRRKFSSFLTLFAISLGILAIFVIILVSQGFENSLEQQFEQLGTNRIIITSEGSSFNTLNFKKGITDNELELVENRPYISEAFGYYLRNVQVEYSNEFITRIVMGAEINERFFEDLNVDIERGRFPKDNERYSVVIGPSAAEDLYRKEINVGSNIYIRDTKFKVVGILESLGNPEDDKNIYIDIDALRDIYEAEDEINMIYATVEEGYDVNLAAENIEVYLENRLGDDSVNVRTFDQLIGQFNDILNIVQYTLGGIAFVSLIVGAFGIINTMYVIITERYKDIGIMKAIGARNGDILFMYVTYSGIFGLLGAFLGIILGSLGGFGFEAWAQSSGFGFLEITISPVLVISLLLFGFGIGAVSGFLPAYRASRFKIVDTFKK